MHAAPSGLPSLVSEFRPPIIIQLNETAGGGDPLPARRFPGDRGGAAYFLSAYGFY